MLQGYSFRKGRLNEIHSLEQCWSNSIDKCEIYNDKQLNIWKRFKPNWEELILETIVCISKKQIVGFLISNNTELKFIYVDPEFQKLGIGNHLVSLVEKPTMRCDCNYYSEKLLLKRRWKFHSKNSKVIEGTYFKNKWYIFEKN